MSQTSLMAWLKGPPSTKSTAVERNHGTHNNSTTQDNRTDPHATESHKANGTSLQKISLLGNVELRACRKEDVPQLKRLTGLLLPIPYPDSFFREIIEDQVTNSITLLAIWHDDPASKPTGRGRLVGAVRCRLFAHPPTPEQPARRDGPMLYLSTLVLLSPYRGHGIAAGMLDVLTRRAVGDYGVTSVGAHVWEENAEGQEWYRKRGFREVNREPNYYPRLTPPGAVVLQRDISVLDLAAA